MRGVMAVGLTVLMFSTAVGQDLPGTQVPALGGVADQTTLYLQYYQAQMKQELDRAKKQLEETTAKHGKDSPQALQARNMLRNMEMQMKSMASGFSGNAPVPFTGASGFGTAGGMEAYIIQSMLQNMKGMNMIPADDPIAMGRRMVMEGLNIQLEALADQTRKAEGDAREALMASLTETVEMVVQTRANLRKQQIARLEKQLSDLKKEADGESAEKLLEKLLKKDDEEKKDEEAQKGDEEKKDSKKDDKKDD